VVRILKEIYVNVADFENWFRKEMKRRGPPSGTTGFRDVDRQLFPEISRLIKQGDARSPYGAAVMLEKAGKLAGDAAPENKAKRVATLYRKERG
jgi:hypothetical protein